MATLPYLSPLDARQRQADGALMVDIRQTAEFQREHIAQSRLYSLADHANQPPGITLPANNTVVFYCLSGARCEQYAQQIAALVPGQNAFLLEGGLNAWKKAGLPVDVDRSQPLPVMRQVQIVAGGLTAISVVLGYTLHPAFFSVAGFIGAGLVFAGISGFCGMARLLMHMPWNKRRGLNG
ncbi:MULTISPECIES: rhodanese family protein [unclassified Symbiopectobacterium]|uniref:rhodanese family protein n=1 Tax=unclassified Symbiopectobacterium TaxID=2794573 RepID=UPI0022271FC4|nr:MULTISPECIES: rhodanese family protein [unclassified Symbiopectobacterium]MCW2473370.1 rhodanese family protein [Candidatus Symbiopectobacterium sp. NZEC151]MCW2484523.1 rhodanese family protein [Candidatus Symbiopectobacterium sp. NZEC127]